MGRYKDPQLRTIALLLLWLTVFWLTFTHLQSRFFVLAIPLASLAVGSIHRPRVRAIVAAAIVGAALPSFVTIIRRLEPLTPAIGVEDASSLMSLVVADESIARAIESSDRPICLAGDGAAFLYPVAKGRLYYRTVFDVDVKEGQSLIDAWTEGAPKEALIQVTPSELERFHRTYFGLSTPTGMTGDAPYLMNR